jgi:copper chaperone CopZ
LAQFTLLIDGMHCGSCVRRVTQALSSISETKVEEVRLGAARLNSDSNDSLHIEQAINALATAGYAAHVEPSIAR